MTSSNEARSSSEMMNEKHIEVDEADERTEYLNSQRMVPQCCGGESQLALEEGRLKY